MDRRLREEGFSLVEILLVVAISGILSVVLSKLFSIEFKSYPSVKARTDTISLRHTILNRLDCQKTYGVPPGSDETPYCDQVLTLKDKHGAAFPRLGDWDISGTVKCSAIPTVGHNYLQIAVTRHSSQANPTDGLTGKPYNSIKTAHASQYVLSYDLFGGTSSLCNDYLSTPSTCPIGGFTNPADPSLTNYSTSYYSTRYDATGKPACDRVTIYVPMKENPGRRPECLNSPYAASHPNFNDCKVYDLAATCPGGMGFAGAEMRCDLPWSDAGSGCLHQIYGIQFSSYVPNNGTATWRGTCFEYFPSSSTSNCNLKTVYPQSYIPPAARVTCFKPI